MNWKRGVVLISSTGKVNHKEDNIGTGFVIHRDEAGTYLLTCAHVVEDVGGTENVIVRGKYPATIVAMGNVDGFDLAVLRVEGLADLPILPLSLKCRQGDRFESLGFSLLSDNKMKVRKLVEGSLGEQLENFSDIYETESELWELQLQEGDYLKKGYSGSPVVHSESGAVMGIVSHLERDGSRGYAISPKALGHIWSEMPGDLLLPVFSFEVVTLNAEGEEINRTAKEAEYKTFDLGKGVTLDMVKVPGGRFWMGTEDEEIERLCKKYDIDYFKREHPRHQVTVSEFWMGKYPVTQAQWQAIMGNNPAKFKGENRPIEKVSWDDCVEFCQKLTVKTKTEFRLPSEAKWEYACRAGTQTPFHFGETITTDFANYRGTDWKYEGRSYPGNYADEPKGQYRQETTPVGSFSPNAFGLYDMHGNLWEWCEDDWHSNYEGAPTDGGVWLDPGDTGSYKLLRGGSWYFNPSHCRSAYRNYASRDDRDYRIGFRVCCEVPRTLLNP